MVWLPCVSCIATGYLSCKRIVDNCFAVVLLCCCAAVLLCRCVALVVL